MTGLGILAAAPSGRFMKTTPSLARRRSILLAAGALLAAWPSAAQTGGPASEGALREAVAQYVAAWNHRDIDGLAALLAHDVHYIEPYGSEKHTREVVAAYTRLVMAVYDLRLDIVRLRIGDSGNEATLVLRGQHLGLPVRDGKYSQRFDRSPLVTRWRLEDGQWRLFYFNDNTVKSAEIARNEKLEG